ncbi:hypothetical protein WJX72_002552 [[Myrmecia] bisecta]|uniref:Ketoreductase domain-containing protein n=1 Tax=[Myrmecia] bisecta TaxID=41462 RepID=A0AAW1PJC1_9CHLO
MASGSVVITGSSTGIGRAVAELLVRKGFFVFGSVRKEADAVSMTEALGSTCFTPLLFDVTDEVAVAKAAATVRTELGGKRLVGLINNAGLAPLGPLELQPLADARRVLDVNVIGQLIVTRAFLPLLGTDSSFTGLPGRIVMISSVGGLFTLPGFGMYSASKHALEAVSNGLRREMRVYGIKVVVVEPGMVKTEIQGKGVVEIDSTGYDGTPYAALMDGIRDTLQSTGPDAKVGPLATALSSAECAETIYTALTARRPWARGFSKVAYSSDSRRQNFVTDWLRIYLTSMKVQRAKCPSLRPKRFQMRCLNWSLDRGSQVHVACQNSGDPPAKSCIKLHEGAHLRRRVRALATQ